MQVGVGLYNDFVGVSGCDLNGFATAVGVFAGLAPDFARIFELPRSTSFLYI